MSIKKPMTEETRHKLNETSLSMIEEGAINVERIYHLLEVLESKEKYNDSHTFKKLLEYKMLLQVLNLDLCTSVRIYLNAKLNYESIFSGRQIRVVIIEGVKKIYPFKDSDRRKAFWVKDIGAIVENDMILLQPEYYRITQKIEDYISMYLNDLTIKNQRDLSVHYDDNASKVYAMLVEVDIEEIYKMMNPFIEILGDMLAYTQKLVDRSEELTTLKTPINP